MAFLKVFLAIFAVLLISETCNAIKCYECQSDIDPKCGEHASSSDLRVVDCVTRRPPSWLLGASTPTKCMKMVRNVFNSGGQTVTNRGCFFENAAIFSGNCMNNPLDRMVDFKSCDVCDTDMCNSAPTRYATFGVTAILVALASYLL